MGGDVCGEANNFEADAVEEIAGEMLEEAARLKEDGAVRAVKKRALVGWLEELVSLGLSIKMVGFMCNSLQPQVRDIQT